MLYLFQSVVTHEDELFIPFSIVRANLVSFMRDARTCTDQARTTDISRTDGSNIEYDRALRILAGDRALLIPFQG